MTNATEDLMAVPEDFRLKVRKTANSEYCLQRRSVRAAGKAGGSIWGLGVRHQPRDNLLDQFK